MRTPAGEAHRIIDALNEQAHTLPEELRRLPGVFFRDLSASKDITHRAVELEGTITRSLAPRGYLAYLLSVLRTCAHAAASVRLPGEQAWIAVLDSQRHAGVSLAYFVSISEAKDARKARACEMKDAQIKINEQMRLFVLDIATRSPLGTPRSVAKNVVGKLEATAGGLAVAVKALGSNLKAEPESLASAFAEYIKKDMERVGLRRFGETVSQPLNRALFARWKKLCVSPAND